MWLGERMRVPRGVNSRGFLTMMRLCVGVVYLEEACAEALDWGVGAVESLRFLLGVLGFSRSSSSRARSE